jgi:hypothetical protein
MRRRIGRVRSIRRMRRSIGRIRTKRRVNKAMLVGRE